MSYVKLTYLDSNISSTESDINIHLAMGMKCYSQFIDHVEIWSIQENKMEFLPSSSCINTTIWMYPMDTNKMHREKVKWELHKNAAFCLKRNPGINAAQNSSYTATCLPSPQPFK